MNRTLRDQPVVAPAPVAPAPTAGPRPLQQGWALLFGLGWPAALLLMMAIEPAPATKPSVAVTVIGTALFLGLYLAVGATVARAVRRSPSAAGWSSVAGLIAVVATITCPLSGHHNGVGAWWYVQLGVSLGMLALSRVAADRPQPALPPG